MSEEVIYYLEKDVYGVHARRPEEFGTPQELVMTASWMVDANTAYPVEAYSSDGRFKLDNKQLWDQIHALDKHDLREEGVYGSS